MQNAGQCKDITIHTKSHVKDKIHNIVLVN